MNFRFNDIVGPIATRFNDAVKKFIEELEKQLKGVGVIASYPEQDVNGFIHRVVLYKNSPEKTLKFEIYPCVDGTFDYKCVDTSKEEVTEVKDLSLISFWTTCCDDEGINFIKQFFTAKEKELA